MDEPHAAFADLGNAARMLMQAQQAGQLDQTMAAFRQYLATTSEPVAWSHDLSLSRFRALGTPTMQLLRREKYRSVPLRGGSLLAAAAALAARITFPTGVLDQLHAVRRDADLSRAEWEHAVRMANALEHLCADFGAFRDAALRSLEPSCAACLRPLANRPALLLFYHGGFMQLCRLVFSQTLLGGLRVQRGPVKPQFAAISIGDDPTTALVLALRALEDGSQLLIAPDARIGTSTPMPVLGQARPMATGAAFLAHRTGCAAFFIHVRQAAGAFSVAAEEAPGVVPGESLASFTGRLAEFYGRCIEAELTGDPGNLALKPMWNATILNAARPERR